VALRPYPEPIPLCSHIRILFLQHPISSLYA
jgi:hypothetical protein